MGVLSHWKESCYIPKWIATILSRAYSLQFESTPPPFTGVLETKLASHKLTCALAQVVEELLTKGAIEPIPHQQLQEGLH